MPPALTSTRSARVTQVRQLHDRRHRAERGAFVVEGPQAVREAIPCGVTEVFVTPAAEQRHGEIVEAVRDSGGRVVSVTDDVLDAMSETRQPQGLVAVCPLVTRSMTEVVSSAASQGEAAFLVILDRVADPGNAGTIIRSADALGAHGVILTAGSVDPHNGKCVRSTAGSIFHIPIAAGPSPREVVDACRASGVSFVLADPHAQAALDPRDHAWLQPLAWVFGSEAHGADLAWHEAATTTRRIPTPGDAESLNLAAAAAICLYVTSQARALTRD